MSGSGANLPSHITLLGESLKPLLGKVQDALRDGGRSGASTVSLAADASRPLGVLEASLERVSKEVSGALGEVVATAEVADAEVHRAIGRFESAVDELLGGYARLCGSRRDAWRWRVHELLVAVYRHTLTELRDWLQDTVATIADPMAAIRKRGLPTSGQVTLDLTLTFTPAPEGDELLNWIEWQEQRAEDQRKADDQRASNLHTWVAAAAGFFLGGLFFGGDE